MKSKYIMLGFVWILTILFGILSSLSLGTHFMNILVVVGGVFLSIFYFYGSLFYFLKIPLTDFRKELSSSNKRLKLIALFLGIPFALASISVVFIVLEFPGGIIVYALSIITWLILYALKIYGFKKQKDQLNFIEKNLKGFILIALLILILIVLKWPSSAIEMKWVEPTTIPGM